MLKRVVFDDDDDEASTRRPSLLSHAVTLGRDEFNEALAFLAEFLLGRDRLDSVLRLQPKRFVLEFQITDRRR